MGLKNNVLPHESWARMRRLAEKEYKKGFPIPEVVECVVPTMSSRSGNTIRIELIDASLYFRGVDV